VHWPATLVHFHLNISENDVLHSMRHFEKKTVARRIFWRSVAGWWSTLICLLRGWEKRLSWVVIYSTAVDACSLNIRGLITTSGTCRPARPYCYLSSYCYFSALRVHNATAETSIHLHGCLEILEWRSMILYSSPWQINPSPNLTKIWGKCKLQLVFREMCTHHASLEHGGQSMYVVACWPDCPNHFST
jgi:hypothetical protein